MTNQTDPSKAGALAQRIVEILANEESGTRQRAIQAAIMLLGEQCPQSSYGEPLSINGDHGDANVADFFDRNDDLKAAEFAQLCAAYHYSQYGAAAFSIAELRNIALEAGVVIPDRLDMTLRQAAKKGKLLFQPAGKALYKPTVAGRLVFEERWKVKPGRKTKAADGRRTTG